MFKLYTCLTDEHDWRLVVLAIVVCFLASAVAINLFHRAHATAGRTRLLWMSLDAVAAGFGIWATHFIGMLAYSPAVGVGYNLDLTILSLVIAVLITGAGFGLALHEFGRWTSAVGGAVVGGGVAVMHYTGMMALEVPGRITWSMNLVVASIALGIIFGAIAVFFAAKRDFWENTLAAVVALTLSIVFMHFTAMGAIVVLPDPAILPSSTSLSPINLSLVIAGAAVIVLGMCLIAALGDRRSEDLLGQQKLLLDSALENMSQGLCMFDSNGRILLFNKRFAKMAHMSPASLNGRFLLDIIKHRKARGEIADDPRDFVARVISAAGRGISSTRTLRTMAGRALRITEQPMKHGGWVSTFEDITESLEAQDKISHMAHHDALTDLANRTQLVKKLEDSLAAIQTEGGNIAVHFIDIDRFKKVNDTLGHDAGDFLLKAVAERLHAVTSANDMVARLGGDEFVVVQTRINGKEQADVFSRRLTAAVTAPVILKEQTIVPTLSVGVALAPADGTNPERLLKCADLALYKAKSDGRNRVRFFRAEMDIELQMRTKLERLIRDATLHDRFELHFQPLFEISERRLIGFEALIRLPADDGTLIPPLLFIPVAEDMLLVDKIGAWVLREACRAAATWPEHLTVAVNLSAQFLAGNVSDVVAAALKESGLAAHRLELEVTETVLLDDSREIMGQLRVLKAMGVAIVMDNFGTGSSGLSYLWKFPFDKIKIDRSFMDGLDDTGRDAETVVKAIIALGRELNLRVTVEGVETATQAAFLDKAAGGQAQGFFFGRPLPASEIGATLLANFRETLDPISSPAKIANSGRGKS